MLKFHLIADMGSPEQQLATASQQINKRDARLDASGNNRSTDIKIEDFDIAFGERWVPSMFTFYMVKAQEVVTKV